MDDSSVAAARARPSLTPALAPTGGRLYREAPSVGNNKQRLS